MRQDFIIVSYYTEGTRYKEEAVKLIQTLDKFDLEHDILAVPNLGDWQKNTQYKAEFIYNMLIKHNPRPIVFLDVDSLMIEYPQEFFDFDNIYDLGLCWFQWPGRLELSSAVMYLQNRPLVYELVKEWIVNCKVRPKRFDQRILQTTLKDFKERYSITIYDFPKEYDVIFDIHKSIKNPVIRQMQASRRLKNEVSRQMVDVDEKKLLFNRYSGRQALILGKGPSLNCFLNSPFKEDYVKSCIIFGVNDVFKVQRCDFVFHMDSITHDEQRELFKKVRDDGTSFWTFSRNKTPGHKLTMEPGAYGFEIGKFFHGYTSAFVALQMALWMGIDKIYLAGIDLRLPTPEEVPEPACNGDYFDGSKAREGKGFARHLNRMRKGFELAAEQQCMLNFQVFRFSDLSTLTIFPVKQPVIKIQ